MKQNIKFAVTCDCGNIVWVSKAEAGSRAECTACSASVLVPPLSKLLKAPSVDASPLGIVLDKIRNANPPFDGVCQICSTSRWEVLLPTRLDFVSKDQMVSPESVAEIQSCILPCYLCHGCDKILARSMWSGFAKQVVDTLLSSFWLVIVFLLAVIVAAILPLVGMTFVAAVVWGLYQQLTRKNANPALLKHLDRVCGLGQIVKEAYFYKLKPLKRVRNSL